MSVKEELKFVLDKMQSERNELKLSELPAPSLIPNLEKAAKRIVDNLQDGKRLLIVGDYDCDGIMATTVMYDFFQELGYGNLVGYIVPDRFVDGYGISKNMVDYAIENLYDFIVTVDNGIGAIEAIDYAKENGIEVILTDHHTPGEVIPNADIIVNLKYELGDFPFMEITGATVAWYLCAQINQDMKASIDMRKWLDLIGITVISDVMPLKSLNVALVKYAIDRIKNKSRYLFQLAFDANKRSVLTETDIGFAFVPMINAVGRLDHAHKAIDILLSKEKAFVARGYRYLQEVNNRRKMLTQELLAEVESQAIEQIDSGAKAIIVKKDNLHEGIVGIIAGKLAEKYMRPSYVFGWNGAKQCWKGSGRTSGSVQLYDLSAKAAEHALGFGGHAGAVGVAINKDNFDKWKNKIMEEANNFDFNEFIPLGEKPREVSLSDINFELLDMLDNYRPFGQEFPMPKFKAKVFLSIIDSYKEGLHTKCLLVDQNGFSATAWFFHDNKVHMYNNQEVDIIFEPVRSLDTRGEQIDLHATINYLNI